MHTIALPTDSTLVTTSPTEPVIRKLALAMSRGTMAASRLVNAIGRSTRRSRDADSSRLDVDISILRLQNMLDDPSARASLRHYLERRQGAEDLEFLIAFRCFEEARNPLQRFQQLSRVVHLHVREGCPRPASLSSETRLRLMHAWSQWDGGNRIPVEVPLPEFERAASEINTLIVSKSRDASRAMDSREEQCAEPSDGLSSAPSTAQFRLCFRSLFASGRGFAFPCDPRGEVHLDGLSDNARNNYLFARAMVGRDFAMPEVELVQA
jgi:hypothetical protein